MRISMIVAMSENRTIGRDGDLPWHLPDDLKRFKRLTMGHSIIMGRKTFDSIGRALPGRTNIVLSRDATFQRAGVEVVTSLEAALDRAEERSGAGEAFIIGGAAIFALALPRADRVYLTTVHANVEGDVFLPPLDFARWHLAEYVRHAADEKHAHSFSYRTYDRLGA